MVISLAVELLFKKNNHINRRSLSLTTHCRFTLADKLVIRPTLADRNKCCTTSFRPSVCPAPPIYSKQKITKNSVRCLCICLSVTNLTYIPFVHSILERGSKFILGAGSYYLVR